MKVSHRLLLDKLREKPYTSEELQLLLNMPKSSITARLSEMRKLGYSISLKNFTVQKYVLKVTPKVIAEKILRYIEEKGLFDTPLSFNIISKNLDISVEEVRSAMPIVFKRTIMLQLEKETILIKKFINR